MAGQGHGRPQASFSCVLLPLFHLTSTSGIEPSCPRRLREPGGLAALDEGIRNASAAHFILHFDHSHCPV